MVNEMISAANGALNQAILIAFRAPYKQVIPGHKLAASTAFQARHKSDYRPSTIICTNPK